MIDSVRIRSPDKRKRLAPVEWPTVALFAGCWLPWLNAIVESNRFWWLLYLYNNLHTTQHNHPQVAWYQLPQLCREGCDTFLVANSGYLIDDYWELFRCFVIIPREPVLHLLRNGHNAIDSAGHPPRCSNGPT